MVAEVIAGLGAFKTMFDIAKAMKDMDDAVKRNAAVFDLGEQIISAQARYTAALEEVRELKEKLSKLEAWEADKQRYKLTDVGRGVLAYALKEGMENGEPAHQLCASCYQAANKSMLTSAT